MVMWFASHRQFGGALSQARRSFGTTAALQRQAKLRPCARAPHGNRRIIADLVDKAGEARYGG
jgi:hypothetical protein